MREFERSCKKPLCDLLCAFTIGLLECFLDHYVHNFLKRPPKYRMAYHQSVITSSRPSLCSSSILFLVFDMQYRLNNNGKSCIPNSIKSQPYLDVKYFKVFFFVFLNRAIPLSQREGYYSRAPGTALFQFFNFWL